MLTLACAGCRATVSPADACATPFVCPNQRPGDDVDHVLVPANSVPCPFPEDDDPNPLARYRRLLASYAGAAGSGIDDDGFLRIVRGLDDAVCELEGRRFAVTPFGPSRALGERLGFTSGELWVKDETGSVGGSHKARHLAGIMLHLQVATRIRMPGAAGHRPPLAIASCGNAALAAGIVARAAGWPLEVFVPPTADPGVVERLRQLGSVVHACARESGVTGDPCYHSFRHAVSRGAIPFCCQGSDNGLTIEGGKTLAWEMVSQIGHQSASQRGASRLDAVLVQVGGGALASAVVQGFGDAVRAGALDRMPRIYAVQTAGAYPLKRAYDAVAERVLARVPLVVDQGFSPAADADRAELIMGHPDLIDEEMTFARTHRSQYMRPWEKTPASVAHGILDDETYDWASVVDGMLRTGGWPLVVSEERLVDAYMVGRKGTGIDVDHTGSAGLAGLMKAVALDRRLPAERVAVIFTGIRR